MMCTGYISFYAAHYLFSVVFGKKARSVNLFSVYVSTLSFILLLSEYQGFVNLYFNLQSYSCFNNQSV